jgi:nitrilase
VERRRAKIAAVQAAPVWLDRNATVEKACGLIEEAGAEGADLIGFPENFIPGHPSWYYFHPAASAKSVSLAVKLFHESVEVPGDATDALCKAAARAKINVVMGVTEKVAGTTGTLYNTQLFIDSSGQLVGKHQKLVATASERLVHAPGRAETQRSFPSEIGVVSALVCGENSNPLAVARIGADYPNVHVASWPNNFSQASAGMPENSLLASRSVAYSCSCFVIASCSVNSEAMISDLAANEADAAFMRDTSKTGGACIINPSGVVVAGPMPGDQEGILYADADFDACIRARFVHDFAGHYNRSDVYQLRVFTQSSDLVTAPLRAAQAEQVSRSMVEPDGGQRGDEGDPIAPSPVRL